MDRMLNMSTVLTCHFRNSNPYVCDHSLAHILSNCTSHFNI